MFLNITISRRRRATEGDDMAHNISEPATFFELTPGNPGFHERQCIGDPRQPLVKGEAERSEAI